MSSKTINSKVLGLDITSAALTAVELSVKKDQLTVVNYSQVSLEPNVVEDDFIILDPDRFKAAVKKLIEKGKNGKLKPQDVIIGIPEAKTFSHLISVSKAQKDDQSYIMRTAMDSIPIELDQAVIDYNELPQKENEAENSSFEFIAAQATMVESVIQLLNEVGLNVVVVDVVHHALIRACENRFNHNESGFMVVHMGESGTLLGVGKPLEKNMNIHSNIGGKALGQTLKEKLNLPIANAMALLKMQKKADESLAAKLQEILMAEYGRLTKKMSELNTAFQNSQATEIKTIYLVGPYAKLPFFDQAIKPLFPNATIIQGIPYLAKQSLSSSFARAAGLALWPEVAQKDQEDINLIPASKREELFEKQAVPTLRSILVIGCILFGGALMYSGISAASSYFALNTVLKEKEIVKEKLDNPYINQVVKYNQQKAQLASQIASILQTSVPIDVLIKSIDALNTDEVSLITSNFSVNSRDEMLMRLRARAISRAATENFIVELSNHPFFSNVFSPLSNLVGKGERFINIDITIDPVAIFDSLKPPEPEPEAEVAPAEEAATPEPDAVPANQEAPTEELPPEETP